MMPTLSPSTVRAPTVASVPSGLLFAAAMLVLMTGSALLAGWAPLGFSIVILVLFAGPHNWIEVRYFLARMPARWGKLRGFFSLALGGVLLLSVSSMLLPWLARQQGEGDGLTVYALWNGAAIGWMVALVHLRSRQHPRRNWTWTYPIAAALLVLGWRFPLAWYTGIFFAHPLLALWLLDRELHRSRPQWRRAYRVSVLCLPVLLAVLWSRLSDPLSSANDDTMTLNVTQGVGTLVLDGLSPTVLVASHAFLSMVHYGVWLIAIPLVGLSVRPWRVSGIPLARRSFRWQTALGLLLAVGAGVVLLLWVAFVADYQITRDWYMSVAIMHILAEVPLLLWAI